MIYLRGLLELFWLNWKEIFSANLIPELFVHVPPASFLILMPVRIIPLSDVTELPTNSAISQDVDNEGRKFVGQLSTVF